MATNEKEKRALSSRQYTVSQVDCNDGKTIWIALRIVPQPAYSSDLVPSDNWLFCRPQNKATGKEDLAPMKTWIGTWGVFWGQRQIVLQKGHRIVREALESLYNSRRGLCWWIKSNFALELLFY